MNQQTNGNERYATVLKMPNDTLMVSGLVPNGDHLASVYGHLIARLESLTLDEWADRITAQYDNLRVMIEIGELTRWTALMRYAEDSIVNFGALPVEFEYTDGVYDHNDIVKILGNEAISYLLADQAA